MDIITPLQHETRYESSSYHRGRYAWRGDADLADDPILRPAAPKPDHKGRMLALPIPSVRPADINIEREVGYMGMNPITLRGETGLLPGRWGDRNELKRSGSVVQPRRYSSEQELVSQQHIAEAVGRIAGRSEEVVIDLEELRRGYTQAVQDGAVFEDSSVESLPFAILTPPPRIPMVDRREVEQEAEDDWVDEPSEKSSARDTQEGSKHKREDSGYSSSHSASPAAGIMYIRGQRKRRKMVRFDEEAIQKQQNERRTSGLQRVC
jgi:hypothetical protein